MISTPNRIASAIEHLERGDAVDWPRLAELQALDQVRAGRQFVEQAAQLDRMFDEAMLTEQMPELPADILPGRGFAPTVAKPQAGAVGQVAPPAADVVPETVGVRIPATVLDVHDGDTVRVSFGGLAVDVRMLDCWAPELSQAGGVEARDFLRARLPVGSRVEVWIPAPAPRKDGGVYLADLLTFGRVLGRLLLGGEDLSATMVAAGHATVTKPPGAIETA